MNTDYTADFLGSRYKIGMWVGLASVVMLFTSLTSAYIVRSGTINDWIPLAVPRVMYGSTALLLLSSVSIEMLSSDAAMRLAGKARSATPIATALRNFAISGALSGFGSKMEKRPQGGSHEAVSQISSAYADTRRRAPILPRGANHLVKLRRGRK